MKSAIWGCISLMAGLCAGASGAAEQLPSTMIKLTVKLTEPKFPASDYRAKPTVHYRAGSFYIRTEEPSDPERDLKGLAIANSPDVWMINLLSKTGQHVKERKKEIMHMPVFPCHPKDPNKALCTLEFTRELEFVKKHGGKPTAGPTINGQATDKWEVTVGDARIQLWTKKSSEIPVRISCQRQGSRLAIDYLAYQSLKFDPRLFEPPSGISIRELHH